MIKIKGLMIEGVVCCVHLWSVIYDYCEHRFVFWIMTSGETEKILFLKCTKCTLNYHLCVQTPEKQQNNRTYDIMTFLAAVQRTVGFNLMHQFSSDVSARHLKEPEGRGQLPQHGHIIAEMTESSNNSLPADALIVSSVLALLLGDRIFLWAWLQRHKRKQPIGESYQIVRQKAW